MSRNPSNAQRLETTPDQRRVIQCAAGCLLLACAAQLRCMSPTPTEKASPMATSPSAKAGVADPAASLAEEDARRTGTAIDPTPYRRPEPIRRIERSPVDQPRPR